MKILNILLYTLHIKNSGLQAFTEGTYDNKMVAKKKIYLKEDQRLNMLRFRDNITCGQTR